MAEEKTFSVGVQTSSPKRISITSNVRENPITASADTGLYYSQLAKNWAIGEELIQNEDYSSKTWAGESKSSADLSKMYSEAASLDLTNLENRIIEYDEQLNTTITEGLDNINASVTGGVETIETTKTEASEYVETTANESIAEVNQAKEQAIKDFNKASDKVNYLFVMPIGTIGFSPFPIDETKGLRRILNGQIIIQEQFTGFVKWLKENIELYPQMACTEEQWQATVTMSTFGQCGKFVIDDEAGTIRLPRITGFIQGLTDLASLGELVEAGLPSISHTHTRGTMEITGTLNAISDIAVGTAGAFTYSATGATNNNLIDTASKSGQGKITFTASRNWTGATSTNSAIPAIYGKSNTVQPEAIRYPYFIQVATGVEESVDVTREIELNNPFFFGYYQYFEFAPNNISWLKSEGQWNSKAVYNDYYNWILLNANNEVENFKLSTDTYDDYCWVVNTADETFRLPIKTKNIPLSNNRIKIYSFNEDSIDTTNLVRPRVYSSNGLALNESKYLSTTSEGRLVQSNAQATTEENAYFALFADLGNAENTNVSLYFYVGETTQNANLINAGRIEEKLVNKVDTNASNFTADGKSLISGWGMPSDKYIDLTLGASGTNYTAPANGWFCLAKQATNSGQWIFLGGSTSKLQVQSWASAKGYIQSILPVTTGTTITINYTADGSTAIFRFVYADGEV